MAEPFTLVTTTTVDYDVHGLVGIRLVDAGPTEVRAVTRQLGPPSEVLDREPDVTLRFVDRLPTSSPLRFLGAGEAAFTSDAFLVLRGRHKTRTRVQIPMAEIGGRCELVCERGLAGVPLLVAIINLTALGNGGVALHAAAFEHRGRGALVTGWSNGGKTEALLAFTDRGARYVGDEWVYIGADGRRLGGLPEPVRVWDWHLAELPELRRRVSRSSRVKLRTLELASAVDLDRAPGGPRLAHAIAKQRHVDLAPDRLLAAPLGTRRTALDLVFFVASTESPETTVAPMDPAEVADRMVASLAYERQPLLGFYEAFRFAFPGVVNPALESARDLEHQRLTAALGGVPTFRVDHPYPVSLRELADAMEPCFDGEASP